MNFGAKIRVFRLLRGLSQEDLANISLNFSKLDPGVIARHEGSQDGTKGVRKKTLEAYALALSVTRRALVGGDEEGDGLQSIFRPLSPYRSASSEVSARISTDLKSLLPLLIADLALSRAHCYVCPLGSVISLEGGPHHLLIVVPTPLSAEISKAIRTALVENAEIYQLNTRQYISFALDPVGALDLPGLPRDLQLGPLSGTGVRELYRPPKLTTRVVLDLIGDRPEIYCHLKEFFAKSGEEIDPKVERPKPWKQNLPGEIQGYLEANGLDVDDEGHVIGGIEA